MRVSPDQLRKALADMFRDPETFSLAFPYLAPRFPVQGATPCSAHAKDVDNDGVFGASCSVTGDYQFPGKLGIGVAASVPLHVKVTATTDPVLRLEGTNSYDSLSLDIRHSGSVALLALAGGTSHFFTTAHQHDAILAGATEYNLLLGLGGTEYARIASGGNVGIGTQTPGEKLEVNGNVKSKGLNQIVFLVPNGSTDGTEINTAISNLPSNGGIIMLTPGTYGINTTINITKNGVKIRGYGGIPNDSKVYQFGQAAGEPVTKLHWTPTSTGGTVFNLASPSGSGKFISDVELSDLTIDCNSKANIGLQLDAVVHSRFVNVHVWKPFVTGMVLTTSQNTADVDTAWNLFLNCSVFDAPVGLQLTSASTAAANSSHNTFIGLSIDYTGDAAIKLTRCDNNAFYDVWIFQHSGTGAGVLIDDPSTAESNYFYHLQADSTFVVAQAGSQRPSHKNIIFGYDKSNSQADPTSPSGTSVRDYVYWTDSQGDTDLRWENLSAALSASNFPATRKNEFGFVFDGTNMWLVFNDGSNKWKWQGTQVT